MAVPAATPDTTPAVLTVAMPVALDDQTPPGAATVRVVVPPPHTVAVPVITPAAGALLTVTMRVAAVSVPQLFIIL